MYVSRGQTRYYFSPFLSLSHNSHYNLHYAIGMPLEDKAGTVLLSVNSWISKPGKNANSIVRSFFIGNFIARAFMAGTGKSYEGYEKENHEQSLSHQFLHSQRT